VTTGWGSSALTKSVPTNPSNKNIIYIYIYIYIIIICSTIRGTLSLDTNLQQEGQRQAAYLALQRRHWGQARLAEPRRFPADFTGELRGEKPPRLRLLQETQIYLHRGPAGITGHTAGASAYVTGIYQDG